MARAFIILNAVNEAHAVEDDVTDGNFAQEGLALGLGADDAREPIDLIASIIMTTVGDTP